MYKRSKKPLTDFIKSNPKPSVYALDCQYGRIGFMSDEIHYSLNTRISAGGCFFIVEVYDDEEGIGQESWRDW